MRCLLQNSPSLGRKRPELLQVHQRPQLALQRLRAGAQSAVHPAPAVAGTVVSFVPNGRGSAGMPIATLSTTSGALALWCVPFATVITDEASEKRPLTLRIHATSYQTEPPNARALLLARLYRRDGFAGIIRCRILFC